MAAYQSRLAAARWVVDRGIPLEFAHRSICQTCRKMLKGVPQLQLHRKWTMSDVPENANEHCPGTRSEEAGKTSSCAGCPNQTACASGELRKPDADLVFISDRLKNINHKLLILSGKGGVGKSTVTANLARALAADGTKQVAILDVDICGPSQARMMGVEGRSVHESAEGWSPIFVKDNLAIMSIAFLIQNRNEAVIWRGARKNALIKQFLKDVDWGTIDYLLIDTPPGTSDEHISVVQYLLQASSLDGAILVTTPQEVALLDVRKEVNFCRKTNVPVLGVLENMSVFVCPCCTHATRLFPGTTGGAKGMCEEMSLRLLGTLPLDPRMAECNDQGKDFFEEHPGSPLVNAFLDVANFITSSV